MPEKPVRIDLGSIRGALRGAPIEPNAAWCVACGASSGLGPELPSIVAQEIAKQPELLSNLIEPDYVRRLAETLSTADVNASWCVACGATRGFGPEVRVLPATRESLSDADIDALAERILSVIGEGGK
jgi:hypothetical protein